MATPFSAMLPSSVMMYHTSTIGSTSPPNWKGRAMPGRLSRAAPMSRSAPAATRTTTTMPHLCQMPSLALPLAQLPALAAAREPVR